LQKEFQSARCNGARSSDLAAFVKVQPASCPQQIVDWRVGGAGIKGQQRAVVLGRGFAGVDPRQIAHAPEVEKGNGVFCVKPFGAGKMEERRQGRAFAAQFNVRGSEIPNHRHCKAFGQRLTVADLTGAPTARLVRQCLAVKPNQFRALKTAQHLGVSLLDHLGGGLGLRTRPMAQCGLKNLLFLPRIGAIGAFTETMDRETVGLDHGRIHAVQRGSRHGAQGAYDPVAVIGLHHGLFLLLIRAYTRFRRQYGIDTMTYQPKSEFLTVMLERGFVADCTDYEALDHALLNGVVPGYIGFDATAKSLHVGSLIQIMMLRWLQRTGHKPITLMGGGTTKVGDPSFRADERPLLTNEQIDANIAGIKQVFAKYLSYDEGDTGALMLNNAEWLDELNYLEFLRDIGRHFSVNRMLSFESVKSRIDREQSLSFLEFNYMILQAYDFLELNRRYGCMVQFGGSDQWGNIVNGIDLTRRVDDGQVFGLTSHLLTTSDGKKMGKTADGAVWLNAEMRSTYEFWQFWRNTTDADVGRFLKLYTELPIAECDRLGALEGSEINAAKIILANEVTTLCHGAEAAAAAEATAREVFEKGGVGDDLPTVTLTSEELGDGVSIVQLIVKTGLAKSGKDAKRLIKENGAKLDDAPLTNAGLMIDAAALATPIKLSAGKKRHALVQLDG